MKKITSFFIISLFISFSVAAKTLEQKKDELKKIYEVGGISKLEYDKSIESLENSDNKKKKKKKKSFTLKKNTKKTSINLSKKKDKDKEEVTIEKINELGEIIMFDKSYYTEGMLKKFSGCGKGMKCVGQKASSYMMSNFGKSPSWGQRYPGKMIKSMAMYEVFYASRLYETRKAIKRFNENKYKKGLFVKYKKKDDEAAIRSLFGMNNGRKNMREALGMDMETPTKEAIQKFWLLGEFLDLGKPKKNEVNQVLIDRQEKLNDYKKKISLLKKKLEEKKRVR